MGQLAALADKFLERKIPAVVDAAGPEIIALMQAAMSDPYPPASQPGMMPHKRSGRLVAELSSMPGPVDSVIIVSEAPYSLFLEYGTSKMAARPFITITLLWLKNWYKLKALEAPGV